MKHTQDFLPQARRHQLVIQQLPDEVLVYDLDINKAYCLNHTAAFVWQHSDGETPVKQIAFLLQKKLRTAVDESIVWFALRNLQKDGLMENRVEMPPMFAEMTRRQLIVTVGKSAAVALPLVFAITAPMPVSAASGFSNGTSCTSGSQCSSGTCSSSTGFCCSAGSGATCNTSVDCCVSGQGCSGSPRICQSAGTGGCVLPDTPIMTAEGREIKARDVVIGQQLLGVNCINGETVAGRVKKMSEKSANSIYSLVAENGAVIHCSSSHPLITSFGDINGKRADLFCEGDPLLVFDSESQKIVEAKTAVVNQVKIFQPVILFEMDTREHTFISGGIVSHNKARFE